MTYLYIFLQSNILEWPVYLPALKKERSDLSAFYTAALITGMNALTHPIVFFLLMNLPFTYLVNVLIAEGFTVTSEAFFLAQVLKVRGARAFLISLAANLISWQVAPILNYLIFR